MIVEGILKCFFYPVNWIINLIPSITQSSVSSDSSFFSLIGLGLYFFGSTPFVLTIGSVITWMTIDLTWAVVEWIYKKIPGIT